MTIVDSNVLLDVLGDEPQWREWSASALDAVSRGTALVINPIIYAEIAPRFENSAALDRFTAVADLAYEAFTREALYAAGLAHRRYRRAGGERDRVLPDFLIGAHAAVTGRAILTRDPRRYRSYFPEVRLITPEITS